MLQELLTTQHQPNTPGKRRNLASDKHLDFNGNPQVAYNLQQFAEMESRIINMLPIDLQADRHNAAHNTSIFSTCLKVYTAVPLSFYPWMCTMRGSGISN